MTQDSSTAAHRKVLDLGSECQAGKLLGRTLVGMALLGATWTGCDPSVQDTIEICGQRTSTAMREECRFQFALKLIADRNALTEAITAIPDDISRDLLRLRLAIHDPVKMRWLCEEATVPDVQDRCRLLLSRPHLTQARPATPPEPDKVPAWPMLMPENIADCWETPYPEIADICRLGFSVKAVNRGKADVTWQSCDSISMPAWRDECHFLVADTLAARGAIGEAFDHCGAAGSFAQNCAVRTAWVTRPFSQTASPADVDAARGIEATLAGVSAATRDPAAPELRGQLDLLSASAWFELYYGSGLADPAAARAAVGRRRADARSGFAWELVRLVGVDVGTAALIRRVHAVWSGELPPVQGSPLPRRCWLGRNTLSLDLLALGAKTTIHTAHYGVRFAGHNEKEDLVIATMEAVYFDPTTPAGTFVTWLDDPRPRVRLTATRLELLLHPDEEAPLSPELQRATADWSREESGPLMASKRRLWSGSADREGCL